MKLTNFLIVAAFFLAMSIRAEEPPDTLDMVCMTGLQDEQYRELRDVCTDQFPELQGPMEEAQAVWAERNAAAVAQFDAACVERLSDLDHNHAADFDASREKARQLMRAILEEAHKTSGLESTCRDYVEGIRLPGMMDVPGSLIEDLVSPGSSPGRPAGVAHEPGDEMEGVEIIAIPAPPLMSIGGPASTAPCAAAGHPGRPRPPPCTVHEKR